MLTLSDMRLHPLFDSMRQRVERAGSGSKGFFGGTFDGGYCLQQNPDEFAALLCFLTNRCRPIKLYGEIGVAAGGVTRMIYEAVGFDRAILIDDGRHPQYTHFIENTTAFHRQITTLIGDSHGELVSLLLPDQILLEEQPFDTVFIDGDHSYEGVKQDIELVKPYCTETTYLIFHDTYYCEGVKRAFAELPHKVAEFINESQPFGIGVARAV